MDKQVFSTESRIVEFLRQKDYRLVRELGSGACGRTVLLHDELIDEHFVCKKFAPRPGLEREKLFGNFRREIKLLYNIQHENVVRVFNYYLFPDQFAGYILMEFVEGSDIQDFVSQHPENMSNLFVQTISGFAYLESRSILHRDIRPMNVLVRDDGVVKIIDLGFGKHVSETGDFDKSISLNWWCETPAEFANGRYDFGTEVYFVGKLFQKLLGENEISHFKYTAALGAMCQHNPSQKTRTFADVEKGIGNQQFQEFPFADRELESYRDFANQICSRISKLETGVKYVEDTSLIVRQLELTYRDFMLEEYVPSPNLVVSCFVDGSYYFKSNSTMSVCCVREFLALLKSSTEEKRRIILANLHTRFDTLPRADTPAGGDDIPF